MCAGHTKYDFAEAERIKEKRNASRKTDGHTILEKQMKYVIESLGQY